MEAPSIVGPTDFYSESNRLVISPKVDPQSFTGHGVFDCFFERLEIRNSCFAKSIDHVTVDRDELGNAVRLRVAIDAQQVPELKADATVVAKIHCGQTSLGYAWFHDLIDTVRSRVLFWI